MRKALHCATKQTVEITCHDHSIIACSRHIYGCYSSRTSRSLWIAHSTQRQPRGCNRRQEWMNQLPRYLFASPPRRSVWQDAAKIIEPKLDDNPGAVFVAEVALQNKFPLSRNFREILGTCRRCIHMFCPPRESIWPASSWKALGCVVGVRCWRVPLSGCQVTVFLLRRLCPCWRS